ncbi:hypothetical protein J5N97_026247 [Dioscorea zingiberensis]|uniref:Uncharacterized protein n=1 Tax=Dioscorea zingiberensis TaxID=325984 RepID=A0A9D5C2Z1_9LILI|nr:hypothetical protein J5N97_026247 [Dioscorea zingiberensis]
MPEVREWAVRVGQVEGGVWMRRGAAPRSPMAMAVDNKENIPPWRSGRRRKSPLPVWYPRTPLRDITDVVHALERRRARMQANAAQRRDRGVGIVESSSPRLLLSTSPLPPDSSPSVQIPTNGNLISSLSDSSVTPNPAVLGTISPPTADGSLETLSTPLSVKSSFSNDQTPATQPLSVKPSAKDPKAIETEAKLCKSIDLIEKAVMESLKRKTKGQPAQKKTTNAQRSILLSLR